MVSTCHPTIQSWARRKETNWSCSVYGPISFRSSTWNAWSRNIFSVDVTHRFIIPVYLQLSRRSRDHFSYGIKYHYFVKCDKRIFNNRRTDDRFLSIFLAPTINEFEHWSHWKAFTPSWNVLMCLSNVFLLPNCFGHSVQVKWVGLIWTCLKWWSNPSLLSKLYEQVTQINIM